MKRLQLANLSEGALLKHGASGRKAILLEVKDAQLGTMYIRFLDTKRSRVLVNCSEFDIAPPPVGTVARGSL